MNFSPPVPPGTSRQTMRGNGDPFAEMRTKGVYSPNVIRVHVGQDNLANRSAVTHKLINFGGERLLFFFIWRPGIDYQNLP